jgi:hypothetical protein
MLPFRAYDIPGALLSGFLILAACEAGYDGTWLIDQEWNPERISRYGVIAFGIGLVIAAASRRVVEEKLVAGWLKHPAEFLLGAGAVGARDWRRLLFPSYYAPLAVAARERILGKSDGASLPDDVAMRQNSDCAGRRNSGAFRGALSSGVRQHPEIARNRYSNHKGAAVGAPSVIVHLYTTCRTLSLGLLTVSAILASGIIWHAAISGWGQAEWRKLGYCLFSLFEAAGMLYRYLKYYRQYTIEELIRRITARG